MPCGDPFVDAAEKAVLAGNPFRFGNEANFEILTDLALWLSENGHATSSLMVKRAIAEITRLRAAQFRWIPLTERGPLLGDSDRDGNVLVRAHNGGVFPRHFASVLATLAHTHWTPIPPVPEKSSEQKDHELWMKFISGGWVVGAENEGTFARSAFLAGLKAARGEKS